jgi:hypothetical protein
LQATFFPLARIWVAVCSLGADGRIRTCKRHILSMAGKPFPFTSAYWLSRFTAAARASLSANGFAVDSQVGRDGIEPSSFRVSDGCVPDQLPPRSSSVAHSIHRCTTLTSFFGTGISTSTSASLSPHCSHCIQTPVPPGGLEPPAPALRGPCSSVELRRRNLSIRQITLRCNP